MAGVTSPPSPGEKESTAKAKHRGDGCLSKGGSLQEDHLNWPNNQITILFIYKN